MSALSTADAEDEPDDYGRLASRRAALRKMARTGWKGVHIVRLPEDGRGPLYRVKDYVTGSIEIVSGTSEEEGDDRFERFRARLDQAVERVSHGRVKPHHV